MKNLPVIQKNSTAPIELTVMEDNTPVDLSGATNATVVVKKPDGTVISLTANFVTDGTDGKILATIPNTDTDLSGIYQVQCSITLPNWQGFSSIESFEAEDNL